MSQSLKSLWAQLSSIGLSGTNDNSLKIKLALTNQITFISLLTSVVFSLVAYSVLDSQALCIVLLSSDTLLILALVLIKFHYFNSARLLVVVTCAWAGLGAQYIVGSDAHMESLAFIQLLFLSSFIKQREWPLRLAAFVVCIVFLFACFAIQYGLLPTYTEHFEQSLVKIFNFMAIGAIFFIICICLLLQNNIFMRKSEEIATLNDELRDNLEYKNSLTRLVIHDMANPVTVLKSFVRLVKRRGVVNLDDIAKLDKPIDSLSRILTNVRNMLTRDDTYSNKESFSLFEVEQKITQLVSYTASKKNIGFSCHNKDSSVVVSLNRSLLIDNILMNVVNNALKFTPRAGQVRLEIDAHEQGTTLKVKDTGPGFSYEQLSLLHQLKNLAPTPGTDGEQGAGIGMSIVRFGSDMLGASICFSNRDDGIEGAMFICKIENG